MQITQEADYAMRIVRSLSRLEPGLRAEARLVSGDQSIPVRFTLKILHKLTGAGIARSYRGVKGGYALAREPGEITMLDVLEAIEGPLNISKCMHDEGHCSLHAVGKCSIHANLSRIQKMMCEELKKVTFADVLSAESKHPVRAVLPDES